MWFRRFLEWMAGFVGLRVVAPAELRPVHGPTETEIKTMVEDAVEQRLGEHTQALFVALKASGVDVDELLAQFADFQLKVDSVVSEREAAVEAAEAALAQAEVLVERAYVAQDQLANAASAMPAPGSIPAIEI